LVGGAGFEPAIFAEEISLLVTPTAL